MDFDEIFRITRQWYKEQSNNFWCRLDHHADCPIGNLAITQQIMSGFWWNFQDNSAMIQETKQSTQQAQTSLAEADYYPHMARWM